MSEQTCRCGGLMVGGACLDCGRRRAAMVDGPIGTRQLTAHDDEDKEHGAKRADRNDEEVWV